MSLKEARLNEVDAKCLISFLVYPKTLGLMIPDAHACLFSLDILVALLSFS